MDICGKHRTDTSPNASWAYSRVQVKTAVDDTRTPIEARALSNCKGRRSKTNRRMILQIVFCIPNQRVITKRTSQPTVAMDIHVYLVLGHHYTSPFTVLPSARLTNPTALPLHFMQLLSGVTQKEFRPRGSEPTFLLRYHMYLPLNFESYKESATHSPALTSHEIQYIVMLLRNNLPNESESGGKYGKPDVGTRTSRETNNKLVGTNEPTG